MTLEKLNTAALAGFTVAFTHSRDPLSAKVSTRVKLGTSPQGLSTRWMWVSPLTRTTGRPNSTVRFFRAAMRADGVPPANGSSCWMIITPAAPAASAASNVALSQVTSAEIGPPEPRGPGTLRVAKYTPLRLHRASSGTPDWRETLIVFFPSVWLLLKKMRRMAERRDEGLGQLAHSLSPGV